MKSKTRNKVKIGKNKTKTRKRPQKKVKQKKVQFGNSFRCVPANEKNKNSGKLVTIDGDLMVITKEKTNF